MKLSEREWTVLNALWETDGAELGTIVNILFPHNGWNRNTVLTYLTRMEAKGLVRIDKDSSPHIYHVLRSIEKAARSKSGKAFYTVSTVVLQEI